MSSALSASGLTAAAVLVAVQTSIGVVFKLTSSGGSYEFSQASSLTLTELLKLIISIGFYTRSHLSQRKAQYVKTGGQDAESRMLMPPDREKEPPLLGARRRSSQSPLPDERRKLYAEVYARWRSEITTPVLRGFAIMALMYGESLSNQHQDTCESYTDSHPQI